jgi:hypothetical protein
MSKTRVTVLSIAVLVAGSSAQIKAAADQIVTLTTSSGGECLSAGQTRLTNQILADGTLAPFTIGANEVLVLTGISWNLSNRPPNANIPVFIASQTDANSVRGRFFAGAQTDALGNSAGSALIPNVVLDVQSFLPCVGLPQGGSGGILVYGFLTNK